jgi:hypothetical protein
MNDSVRVVKSDSPASRVNVVPADVTDALEWWDELSISFVEGLGSVLGRRLFWEVVGLCISGKLPSP